MAHGKYALLVRCPTPAQRTHAFLIARNLPEPLRHHHFGRAYVFITPAVPDRHTVFITAGTAGFPQSRFFEVATSHGNFQTTFTDQVDGGEDWHRRPDRPARPLVPARVGVQRPARPGDHLGRRRKGHGHALHLQRCHHPITGLIGGFTEFAFGFLLRGAAPVPFDIYYDDIALDTHRLGPVK